MEQGSKENNSTLLPRTWHSIRGRLLAGILVVAPLWLTYVSLRFFFRVLDSVFAPLVKHWFGVAIPGFGFLLLILFIYFVGMITSNILGRSLFNIWESILHRIPLVKNIYQGAKQLIQAVSLSKTSGFKRVVLVEYPRHGLRAVAFVTNSVEDKTTGQKFLIVFIPTTPNPTSGVFEMVPEHEIIETDLTVENGIKMVISGGLVTPTSFATGKGAKPSL